MSDSSVVIVSPATAGSNNGNARTAQRWQELLAPEYDARIVQQWPDAQSAGDRLMLALHARRSAGAIAAWAEAHAGRGLAVVLTGTDLYQDLKTSPEARHSLELAQRLVVLQERGIAALPMVQRAKAQVIFQSTPDWPAVAKPDDLLQVVMVGHLRAVKTPQTLFEAARLLRDRPDIRITHIGDDAGAPVLGAQARATAADCPHYRWLAALPHDETRRCIQQAHLLVHTSALEGGAHVIMEAIRSGTPVLASRVDGNVGMLGADYAGYFPHGDARALAELLVACRAGQGAQDPAPHLLERLAAQCADRAPLFAPETEQRALIRLLHELETT